MDRKERFILWFSELGIKDVPLVGGKNASLGEMYRLLTPKGVSIPNGFAVTANSYRYLIQKTEAKEKIKKYLSGLDTNKIKNLQKRGHKVRKLIRNLKLPNELQAYICEAYSKLERQYGKNVDVAVRSSATAEDLPDASFAGQQETFLNVKGIKAVLRACRNCFASLFTDRAISYRVDKGFDHFSVALSIGIQKMVRSDLASSGVMFTIDTESGFKNVIFLTGAYGLGENVVQGNVNPDEFYIFKPTLKKGFKPIIQKKLGEKRIRMVYTDSQTKPTRNIKTSKSDRGKFCLTEKEILQLAEMGMIIEEHYSKKAGHFKPMDIEWAKDGKTNKLFIVQARPETVKSQKDWSKLVSCSLKQKGTILATGKSVGEKIGQGKAHIIDNAKKIHDFRKGEVLVTDMTDPDWEPIMKIASAIVTNRGGRTCHAAIVSRELGIPCIVGTNDGTSKIRDKQKITVDCSSGSEGYIYRGLLKYQVREIKLRKFPKTKTKIMMNVSSPEEAFEHSFIPNQGVGLAREEFIINSYIRVHPLALLNFNRLEDMKIKKQIVKIANGYKNKGEFFVDKLAEGIGMIAAAFYPKQVIVRLSDFKSNEYANLIGGKMFEPKEDNPMLGWRGASRYYSEKYEKAFALECHAIRKVRDEMGLTNVEVMIPFPRTVLEAEKVIRTMAKHGLRKGKNGLRVIGMCEIPANVILAEEFLGVFDGFSIGTNDLTQLVLGVDRDSELVAEVYDERNSAVKKMVEQVIKIANKKRKYIGICEQAPSDYPEFAQFIVRAGIHSMSLNPDTVVKTTLDIARLEKKMKRK